MKNIFLVGFALLMVLFIHSCNDRGEGNLITGSAAVKIDSVKIAQDSMDIFTTQTIKTYATYRKNCEGFYGYDYVHATPFTREVTAYLFTTDVACEEQIPRASFINFRPQQKGDYHFKFWGGKDPAGNDLWIEETITVR